MVATAIVFIANPARLEPGRIARACLETLIDFVAQDGRAREARRPSPRLRAYLLFCVLDFELEVDEPVVEPDPEVLPFIASNTDMPCGPIVISTGSPSFDLACTTNDSATIFTSVNPADCKSCWIFWAAIRLRPEPELDCAVV